LKKLLKRYFPFIFNFLKKAKGKYFGNSKNKGLDNYNTEFRTYQATILHKPVAERKRVLHVIVNFWTGGSARLVVDLIEHLGHMYGQKVLTKDIPDVPAYTGFPMIIDGENEQSDSILKELNNYKPDLVHIHYLGHHRDKWGKQSWEWYNKIFNVIEKLDCPVIENVNIPTEPFESNIVSYYVYVSEYVKEKFGQAQHQNKVIYPGSDFTHFTKLKSEEISDNCIGMVYRLERDKINEESIDVFIEVVKKRKDTKVLIVGGGSLLEHYKKAVDDAGLRESFTFTGYVAYDDLPLYYKKMSVFVAPVHRESFGQVTPMAMNMGIPVAGYDVGAIPEIIANKNLLAPSGDIAKLSEIIIDLLDNRDKRLKIGASNQLRAENLFSVTAMIQSYKKIYKDVLLGEPG